MLNSDEQSAPLELTVNGVPHWGLKALVELLGEEGRKFGYFVQSPRAFGLTVQVDPDLNANFLGFSRRLDELGLEVDWES